MSDLVKKAEAFARTAHIGQERKYTGDPYIVHPEAVAKTVASVTTDETTIAAAWLHDVVEDVEEITLEEISAEFGQDVAGLIDDLTNPPDKTDGDRAQRKAKDHQHTAQADPRAKTVKLADLMDNLTGIVETDPDFARTYLDEKELQLQALTEGHPELFKQVEHIIRTEKALLGEEST
jgi:(p)ppGpp synthase/HD superfamily hydrolase